MAPLVGTREQILDRVLAVLSAIPGVVTAARNRADLAETTDLVDGEKFPAVILLDGSEEMTQQIAPNKSVRMPPAIMCLHPEIFVVLPQRDDATNSTLNGAPAPVGPELTLWRDKVISALINDPVLVGTSPRAQDGLLTTSGQIVYRGCQTDMATGRTLWGQLQIFVDLYYVWVPPTS